MISGLISPAVLIAPLPAWNAWPHALRHGAPGIIGTIAAILTTVALVPQFMRVWARKSAEDVSLGMFVLYSLGVFLWFIYGVLIHSLPVECANGISFIFAITILILKVYFDRREQSGANGRRKIV